ncbi:ribonuclease Y [Actinotalea ferrariae CF5-4]|uniref:Ribonuclease Y n=1 Tax=Actinotalea ferrariae CF5-4 TaxID=948458 RepID=A0A021VQC0_9CELL|nr:ribonuclease Y [Actinotalea ferrariae]EYR63349.1 ribonuclease Y [Actinotalea ferrariae CF5-4]
MGEVATVLVLLLACLIALVLVLLARREAEAHRRQSLDDVAAQKDEVRARLEELQGRQERLARQEQELSEERHELRRLTESAERRLAEAESERGSASALRAEAERLRSEAADVHRRADDAVAARLEALSGLSAEEARQEQVRMALARAESEAAAQVRRVEARARRTADERARSVVASAVQRLSGPTSAQSVVTVLPLPAEEMKGRIIGKEGRNIRAFEALTGVNVIIDDTPDSVTLSSFDAERREVAAVTLAALMEDGRIHPQRIEIAYAEALAGAQARAVAAGHEAAERAGVDGLHPELVEVLGRLRLRTSYGQNVLSHLVECAHIAGVMAAEIGADVEVARRAAFLHDVGKALTAERPGTHAALGAELAERLGESAVVVNAIAAHHDEVTMESVEAVLVQAADTCSAARPGARREELDQYIERMDTLEALVAAHAGVRRAVAMAAGREVRVVVEPSLVDDRALPELAGAIARHIEKDLSFPGEITVTVVRELRASATAG